MQDSLEKAVISAGKWLMARTRLEVTSNQVYDKNTNVGLNFFQCHKQTPETELI